VNQHLKWMPVREVGVPIPKDALIVRGRFQGQHPNMEQDYVLVALDGDVQVPVTGKPTF
jgi:hypothetical protein